MFQASHGIDFRLLRSAELRTPPSTNCFKTGVVRVKFPKMPISFRKDAST